MLALRKLAGDRVSVGLLAPDTQFWYRPLAVAEPFGLAKTRHFDLPSLADEAGALFVPGELVSVDAANRLAHTSPGGPVPYEALLIACGAVPTPAVPGAITFRGPADTPKIEQLLAEIEVGAVQRVVSRRFSRSGRHRVERRANAWRRSGRGNRARHRDGRGTS